MKYCTDREAKDALIAIGHQLYQQGLIVGTDGNLSCRVTRDTVDHCHWGTEGVFDR